MKKISIFAVFLLLPSVSFAVKNPIKMVTYFPSTYVAHTKLDVTGDLIDPNNRDARLFICATNNCDMQVGSKKQSFPSATVPFYADKFDIGTGATVNFIGSAEANKPLVVLPHPNSLDLFGLSLANYLEQFYPVVLGDTRLRANSPWASRFVFDKDLLILNINHHNDLTPDDQKEFSGSANTNTLVMMGQLSIFKRHNNLPLCTTVRSHEPLDYRAGVNGHWASDHANAKEEVYKWWDRYYFTTPSTYEGKRIGTGVMRWRKLNFEEPGRPGKPGADPKLFLTCETCYHWKVKQEMQVSESGDNTRYCGWGWNQKFYDDGTGLVGGNWWFGSYVPYPSHGMWGPDTALSLRSLYNMQYVLRKDPTKTYIENCVPPGSCYCEPGNEGKRVIWRYCYPFHKENVFDSVVIERELECVNTCNLNDYPSAESLNSAENFCSGY